MVKENDMNKTFRHMRNLCKKTNRNPIIKDTNGNEFENDKDCANGIGLFFSNIGNDGKQVEHQREKQNQISSIELIELNKAISQNEIELIIE